MPQNTTPHQERLHALRREMDELGIDGLIIARTDEFQGEFLAPYAERLAWLSGFTGSAGLAIILKEKAVVMSDGRYTIQLQEQVDVGIFDTADSVQTSIAQWLSENTNAETDKPLKIGYDLWLHTPKQIEKINEGLQEEGAKDRLELHGLKQNPIDKIWHNQPARPQKPVTIFPHDVAGKTARDKRQEIAEKLKESKANACLITLGDSICWLLNIRGGDIDYSPLPLSFAILHDDATLDWFIDAEKVSDDVKNHIGQGVNIHPFEDIENHVANLNGTLWLDRKTTAQALEQTAINAGLTIHDEKDPCIHPKSIKTSAEQAAIKQAHIADGVAMVKFLKWFEETQNNKTMTELSVEEKLEEFRCENDTYLGPSFSTIAGFNANGAIVHYRADEKSSKDIRGDGLLLIDSGGQYQWGTTDITRTLPVGTPSQEMRENYTRVLQAHIALASAQFEEGTLAKELDEITRTPLRQAGLDYAHGTGHGVGCYLCVHEAAANISWRGEEAPEAGMLLSNEPGYYKEGAYGIRLENLILFKSSVEQGMLESETVTMCPFDPDMIEAEMLSDEQRAWMNAYNQKVRQALSEHLEQDTNKWLEKKTRKI